MTSFCAVISSGFLSSFQDLGRKSYRSLGFPRGGVMDVKSVSLINTLLGNSENETVIEFCQQGPILKFEGEASIVLGGGVKGQIDGVPIMPWKQYIIKGGQVLDCGHLVNGTWGYLAIKGGFTVKSFLGSSSTNTHLGIGGNNGRTLSEGERLTFYSQEVDDQEKSLGVSYDLISSGDDSVIRCVKGAQWDWFSTSSQERFLNGPYTVSATSNRVGYRLQGEALERSKEMVGVELPSEGANVGTIQVSNNGLPIVLMSEAQSIGGYPKIAHVIVVDQGRIAQLPAGKKMNFQLISYRKALALLKEQEREILCFREAVYIAKNT